MGLIIAVNLFRTGGYPLGYIAVTLNAMVFAVVIGTDSFAISAGGKLPPAIQILGSSGLYEIAAYVLAATATASISKYRLVGKRGEKMSLPNLPSVIRERNVGIVLSFTLLAIACGWEAYLVSLATAF